jgi:hypothetical protein
VVVPRVWVVSNGYLGVQKPIEVLPMDTRFFKSLSSQFETSGQLQVFVQRNDSGSSE